MTATKLAIRTARLGNVDRQMRFYFGDAKADPPNGPRVEVTIVSDGSSGQESHKYDVAIGKSTLSPQQRTALVSAMLALFEEAVAAEGFEE